MNLLRRLLDKLSVYLPLIVMGVLASGSWWLVRSVPDMLHPTQDKAVRVEPDYRLGFFSIKSFDTDGVLKQQLSGDQAQHFPAAEALHIQNIRLFAQNGQGVQVNAQADKGVATDDGRQVTLTGNAQVIRSAKGPHAPMALTGESLMALPEEGRVVSTQAVQIQRDTDVFTSASLDFNSRTGEYQMQGRVRGSLAPQP